MSRWYIVSRTFGRIIAILLVIVGGGATATVQATASPPALELARVPSAAIHRAASVPLAGGNLHLADATPRSLTAGDLTNTGRIALIAGYATPTGGALGIWHARASGDFTAPTQLLPLSTAPDFLTLADVNHDGWLDLVLATQYHPELHWLPGSATGFGATRVVPLAAGVTALYSADWQQPDGNRDLFVGIADPAGQHAELLLFAHPQRAFTRSPHTLALPAPVVALAAGAFTTPQRTDLAIAAGRELLLLRALDAPLQRLYLHTTPTALAVGSFLSTGGYDLAIAGSDETLRLLDPRTGTQQVYAAPAAITALQRVRLSGLPHDELLLHTPEQVEVLLTNAAPPALHATGIALPTASPASLALRLNHDALSDLVWLDPETRLPHMQQSRPARTFTVNVAEDQDNGSCTATACSLRDAITAANRTAGMDTIAFDLEPTATRLVITSTLPLITQPILIDGTTQPGYTDVPVIELDGSSIARISRLEATQHGLVLATSGSSVRGLRITGFPGSAVVVQGGDTIIQGCEIGLAADGIQPAGNLGDGILIENAPRTEIGGTTPAQRNVIAFQRGVGIRVQGNGASETKIIGNLIGTRRIARALASGAASSQSNAQGGIYSDDAPATQIGGTGAGAGNIISSNGTAGIILFRSGTAGTVVQGNLIGTDQDGSTALPNGGTGIILDSVDDVLIGGSDPNAGNIISGNVGLGIIAENNANRITIKGNLIGTDRTGTIALGNQQGGLRLRDVRDSVIGGAEPEARNLISGNGGIGLALTGSSATRNVIQGNYIGLDRDGGLALGNSDAGVLIEASNNRIGGTGAGEGNVISGNRTTGLRIRTGAAASNIVQGNYIGTDQTGQQILGNGEDGVLLFNAPRNVIGGTEPNAGNVIAGNQRHGIVIQGDQAPGNTVQGNYIGTNPNETNLSNGRSGIILIDSSGVRIGGRGAGEANIIVGHRESGIFITLSNAELNSNILRDNTTAVRMQGGQVLVLGNVIENNATAFVLNRGDLRATLNQITGYERALERNTGTFIGDYNWWGRGTGASPAGLPIETWNRRLLAVPTEWNIAPEQVTLGGASLRGTSGTAAIVRYERTTFDLPSQEQESPVSEILCSDYYTLFTIDGGGLWEVRIPIDDTPDCQAVLERQKLFRVSSVQTCRGLLADLDCWERLPPSDRPTIDRPTISLASEEQQLVLRGLQTPDLEAIVYMAADIPETPLGLILGGVLAVLLVLGGGGYLWYQRMQAKRAPAAAPPPSDAPAAPSDEPTPPAPPATPPSG